MHSTEPTSKSICCFDRRKTYSSDISYYRNGRFNSSRKFPMKNENFDLSFTAFLCLLFSSLYHTMLPHSEDVLIIFGRLDYSGIILCGLGQFIPWIFYQFYCEKQV